MQLKADPESAALDPERVEALVQRARREVDAGLLPSCQLALARHGQLGVLRTLGAAEDSSRYVIFSCTKAAVAGAAWILISEGKLDPTTKAAELIPDFATNGKGAITLEQLLTHTSGFPNAPLGAPDWLTRDGRLARFARWRPEFEPGSRFWYHPTAAHWVVAHMIEEASGADYRRFLAEWVMEPLGLHRFQLGVPREDQADITELVKTGEPATPEELKAVLGITEMPPSEVTDDALVGFNEPDTRALGVPGGGGVTGAAELALYYQALMHNPGGLWDEDVLADGTGRVRVSLPDAFGIPSNRTLGLILAGDDGQAVARGFGRTAGPRTFGHGGAAGQIAWADPDSGISFAYLTNGVDANTIRIMRRGVALSSLAGACAAD
ncbi:MAG TPA: serine hydrolase domain-containing protein [Acidimicrobiales bacterium]|nr:serine hydrolase domain-containing protein [Acidimicrobiales bacterium]